MLDWKQLFETQLKLDYRIKKEKNLHDIDLINKKILALYVELGEFANEWRGFKFWKENPEPTPKQTKKCTLCNGSGRMQHTDNQRKFVCHSCKGVGYHVVKDVFLEEYVDVLHFILSIGNDIGFTRYTTIHHDDKIKDATDQFNSIFNWIGILNSTLQFDRHTALNPYCKIVGEFINLGKLVGFSDKDITEAYYSKNKTNHKRQESNY